MPTGRRFRSNRGDGRFSGSLGALHARLKASPPRLCFDPQMPPDDFAAWRNALRDRLRELMQLDLAGAQPPPELRATEQRDGYELQKWEAFCDDFGVVPFLVLVPHTATPASPGPAVLCCPGSRGTKELLAGEAEPDGRPTEDKHPLRNRMALWFARAGFVAVAVDNPGIGEQADPGVGERFELSMHAIWMGTSYEAISVAQKLPVLDWLRHQSFVDPERIALCGHSLGAKPALIVGALDDGVAAVIWNDFCSDWRQRAILTGMDPIAVHQYVPGMLRWMDYTDILASLAPRPLLITEGGRTPDIHRIRAAYGLLGAADRMHVEYYPRFATPDLRPHDTEDLREGLSGEEYLERVNVDVPQHCFKDSVAVPWLSEVLGPVEGAN